MKTKRRSDRVWIELYFPGDEWTEGKPIGPYRECHDGNNLSLIIDRYTDAGYSVRILEGV